jgi:ribosomal protein S18 acetylase RimI-like enzyme
MLGAMSEHEISIRRYQDGDRDQVLSLAPRLTEWVARWRDPDAVLSAVQDWISDAVSGAGKQDRAVFVAAAGPDIAGVVSVSERTHFTGQVDGYVGELVTRTGMERRGIASRLMAAAEDWAADRGLAYLTLDTGAANHPARALYASLGYQEEDVRLTKPLGGMRGSS